MSFDLPADLESRVARYADESHVSPDEAVRQLVEDGLRSRSAVRLTPAQRLIGLFSSPEDVAIMEAAEEAIAEGRRHELSLPPREF